MKDTRVTYRISLLAGNGVEMRYEYVVGYVATFLHDVGVVDFYTQLAERCGYRAKPVPTLEVTVLCHHEDFPQSAVLHVAHQLAAIFDHEFCEWERASSASGSEPAMRVIS